MEKTDGLMRELDESVQSPKPSAFPQFSQLPAEIRIQIWKQAYLSSGPRIVELSTCKIDHDNGIPQVPLQYQCGPVNAIDGKSSPDPQCDVKLGQQAKLEIHVHRTRASLISPLFSVNREAREEKLGMLISARRQRKDLLRLSHCRKSPHI